MGSAPLDCLTCVKCYRAEMDYFATDVDRPDADDPDADDPDADAGCFCAYDAEMKYFIRKYFAICIKDYVPVMWLSECLVSSGGSRSGS